MENLKESNAGLIKDMINKRRDKTIAIILSMKDRECDQFLPQDVSKDLRKTILDQINDLCDLACDLINTVTSEDVVLNESYLRKIDQIHEALGGNN